VKPFHAFKDDETIRSADEAIFIAPRKHPETNAWYQHPGSNNGVRSCGDIIISLIYHQSCRKYRAAARKQRVLDQLWA
jgi:hypothetical protein